MRHNSLVSLITKLWVSAECRDVVTEPLLLPTAGVTLPPGSNTAGNARADVIDRSICNPLDCIQDTLSSRAALGLPAFRPSASREQRYLAYNPLERVFLDVRVYHTQAHSEKSENYS